MTPNTAAALRALEQKFRIGLDKRPLAVTDQYVRGYREAMEACADELAAVLTQDGADKVVTGIPLSHSCVFGQFAQSEPRVAEGAGTYTPVGNGNIDCCECGETYSAHTNGTCPTPTAAAAVTAGDAGIEAELAQGMRWAARCAMVQFERDTAMRALKKIAGRLPKEPGHDKQAMRSIAADALDRLKECIDYKARGGVTEAVKLLHECVRNMRGQDCKAAKQAGLPIGAGLWNKAIADAEAFLSSTAAQAQDAGEPK